MLVPVPVNMLVPVPAFVRGEKVEKEYGDEALLWESLDAE